MTLDIRYLGSTAAGDFEGAILDAETLLSIHARFSTGKPGRPEYRLEALKRSALILAVTAWETYIEDYLGSESEALLRTAASPGELSWAGDWLRARSSGAPGSAGRKVQEWKEFVRERVGAEIQRLHSPNSTKIRTLAKKTIGIDITQRWHWQGVSVAVAARRLDQLVRRRGAVVHRGKPFARQGSNVRLTEARAAIVLCRMLVKTNEETSAHTRKWKKAGHLTPVA